MLIDAKNNEMDLSCYIPISYLGYYTWLYAVFQQRIASHYENDACRLIGSLLSITMMDFRRRKALV